METTNDQVEAEVLGMDEAEAPHTPQRQIFGFPRAFGFAKTKPKTKAEAKTRRQSKAANSSFIMSAVYLLYYILVIIYFLLFAGGSEDKTKGLGKFYTDANFDISWTPCMTVIGFFVGSGVIIAMLRVRRSATTTSLCQA
eukprot:gnl/MRDRNA2_/MRDRNA2_85049_c0_seq1.p1 gnl/MRDRNA2_/MRDRNA2_85049_c0~~gnl/MRDRNA2_/MRDRNA2_85049_c0_seq1.p1  ORF type:complete len:140 (-),score=16.10 gnl/MRDRNA2_/MRDRNA2_85049_c0_seq1:248-667(-)